MRFKSQSSPPPPQVDLIPMLTVMMGVLAFFVVVTTTLSREILVEVQLPGDPQTAAALSSDPLIIELVGVNDVRIDGQPIAIETIPTRMEAHLRRYPNDTIFLLPNPDLPYEAVMQFLGEMRRIGGDRVSLAIEEG